MSDLAFEAFDRPMRPDQYQYVETHAWWLGSLGPCHHLSEHRLRQWVPARPEQDWLLDRAPIGRQTWLTGSADEARDGGYEPGDIAPVGRFRAPFGDFDAVPRENGEHPSPGSCGADRPRRRGTWQTPTPEFLAALPRDPSALREQLCEENPGSWFGPFAAAVTALRSCLVRADLRSPLYQALAGLPAVSVAEGVRNVDGRECLALVHDAGRTRTELMIDPAYGRFAGERDTLRRDSRSGLTAGTVISDTAVHTAVVDELGALPVD